MKQTNFFLTLFMAIVMMAMCPQMITAHKAPTACLAVPDDTDTESEDEHAFHKYAAALAEKFLSQLKSTDSKEFKAAAITTSKLISGTKYHSDKTLEENKASVDQNYETYLNLLLLTRESERKYLCLTAEENSLNISLWADEFDKYPCIEYSYNKTDWYDYTDLDKGTESQVIHLTNKGDCVYFRAGKTTDPSYTKNETFGMLDAREDICNIRFIVEDDSDEPGKFSASGNVMSLLDQKVEQTSVPAYAFTGLFEDCANMLSAPDVPATELSEYCYYYMFSGCTSLTKAPVLPATTLVNGCYQDMFSDCASLTTAPIILATELANGSCYNMFNGCKSLSNVGLCFTDWKESSNATDQWLYDVSENGICNVPVGLDISERGVSTIPSGWYTYTTTPSNGTTVSCIDNVLYDFPTSAHWYGEGINNGVVTEKITITNEEGTSVGASITPYWNGGNIGFKCDPLFDDGTYTITVPKGCVQLESENGEDDTVLDYELILTLKVKDGAPSLSGVKTNPYDGAEQQSLSSVTYTFNGYKTADWGVGISASTPTDKIVIKKDGETLNTKVTPNYGTDDNELTISFDKIVAKGTYTITIPAGCLKLTTISSEGDEIYPTKEDLVITEVINSVEYVATPEDGTTVETIKDLTFAISGEDADGVVLTAYQDAVVYDINGKEVYKGSISKNGRDLKVTVNQMLNNDDTYSSVDGITADGTYTIAIPKGAITVDGITPESDLTATLTISNQPVEFSSNPVNGANVKSIQTIVYSFPNATQNISVDVENYKLTVNGTETDCTTSAYQTDITVKLKDAITTPGTYNVIIPAGMITIDDNKTPSDICIQLTIPGTPTVTYPSVRLNPDGYATYSSAHTVVITTSGVTPYTATVRNDVIKLNVIPNYESVNNGSYTINAGTGVILVGNRGKLVNFAAAETDAETQENDLLPTTTAEENLVAVPTSSGTIWSLGADDNLYKFTGDTFKANRAYLIYNLYGENAKVRMVFDNDETTGISQVSDSKSENAVRYNLNGQRVNSNAKGIILRNGHKYFNK